MIIEPCPFCNSTGKPEFELVRHPNVESSYRLYHVYCTNTDCGATGPVDFGESGAIEKWNEAYLRSPLPATPEVRKCSASISTTGLTTLYRVRKGTPATRVLSQQSYDFALQRIESFIASVTGTNYTSIPCWNCGGPVKLSPLTVPVACPSCNALSNICGEEPPPAEANEIK